jgi:hypothetical protein
MKRRCAVAVCGQATSGYSTHCEAHKRTLRRHGHAEQTGVTVHELAPHRKRVEARRAKNPGNPTWALLEARWVGLTGHAEATLREYATGAVAITYERQTAQQLVALRDAVSATDVIDTALAMYAIQVERPARFRSDRAYLFELSRRVRGLAEVNAGSRWSPSEGRMKKTYTEVPPKVLECLGASLQAAFGVAGLRLAELDKRDVEATRAEKAELYGALRELK